MMNRKLDEILSQAFTDGASDTMWANDRHVEIFKTAKEEIEKAIIDIIGEDIEANHHLALVNPQEAQNRLKKHQRQALNQWLGK